FRAYQRDGCAHRCDHQLEVSVGEKRSRRLGRVPSIRPAAGEVTARTKAQHEDGDNERGRIDRVAEDVAENADPDDLVGQPADAGAEEKKVKQTFRITPNFQSPTPKELVVARPCSLGVGSWPLEVAALPGPVRRRGKLRQQIFRPRAGARLVLLGAA